MTRAYYTLPNYLAPSAIRCRVYRHEILNEARHPRHRGEYGALPRGVSAGEDREPERVRTGQPREANRVPGRESMAGGDGDARRCLGAPRRRELTGLVADAGVVGKAKASESQDELRRERQPTPGERRSLYFAQHPDFMGRPPRPRTRRSPSPFGTRELELPLCNAAAAVTDEAK